MKKYFITLLIILSFIATTTMETEGASLKNINILINGEPVNFTMEPRMIDGRMMLPVREMFEFYGFDVKWDKFIKTITISKKDKIIILKEAQLVAKVNKTDITQSTPLKMVNGSYFAAAEIFQAGLNINVKYSDGENTLYLSNKGQHDISITGDDNMVTRGDSLIIGITTQPSQSKIGKKINEADKMYSNKNYLGAIKCYDNILKNISSEDNPQEYAEIVLKMATIYVKLAKVINKEENSLKAIALFDEVAKKLNGEKHLLLRAAAFKGIGNAYMLIAKVRDMEKNSPKAINALDEAIKIYKKEEYPIEYADAQYCKAINYINMINSKDAKANLQKALSACDEALSAIRIKNDPVRYSLVRYCQGLANEGFYIISYDGDFIKKALDSYNEALKIISRKVEPNTYACIKSHIGQIYQDMAYMNPNSDNLEAAIKCYNDALEVLTATKNPYGYACVKENIGKLYVQDKSGGNKDKAVAAFNEALLVFTPEEYPIDYAWVQSEIGMAYKDLAEYNNSEEYYNKAIDSFNNALSIFTLEKFRNNYAKTYTDLGATHLVLKNKIDYDDIKNSIDCFDKALKAYNSDTDPILYGYTQLYYAKPHCWLAEKDIDRKVNSQIAISACNEATKILNFEKFPELYSSAQYNMANAYYLLSEVESREENVKLAIYHFDEALKFYTQKDYPNEFKEIYDKKEQALAKM